MTYKVLEATITTDILNISKLMENHSITKKTHCLSDLPSST